MEVGGSLSEEGQAMQGKGMKMHHGLTPVRVMKIQYLPSTSDSSTAVKVGLPHKAKPYVRRADQLTILLVICAAVVVGLVCLALFLKPKMDLKPGDKLKGATTAVVDFYQGNHAFNERMAAEKAHKESHEIHGISSVNDELEVPLSEQMDSMNEKMRQMRLQKATDEPAPPTSDAAKYDIPPLKPTKEEDFRSPLEFNNTLPKVLQKGTN